MTSYNNDSEIASKIEATQDIENRSNCTSITQLDESETDPANPKVHISVYTKISYQ